MTTKVLILKQYFTMALNDDIASGTREKVQTDKMTVVYNGI